MNDNRSSWIIVLIILLPITVWFLARPERPPLDNNCEPNGFVNSVYAFIQKEDFWREKFVEMSRHMTDLEDLIDYAEDGMHLAFPPSQEREDDDMRVLNLSEEQAEYRMQQWRNQFPFLKKCMSKAILNYSYTRD